MADSYYTRPRPSGGWELFTWLFMRISGVALLFLALGHLIIMHLVNNVDHIDYDFVAVRWQGWFWRGYDLLMLVLALVHGMMGVRIVLEDYVPRRWRALAVTTLRLVVAVIMLLGIYAAVFFKAEKAGF